MLSNIPIELQRLPQWVCASGALMPDGNRNKEPLNPRTGRAAKVTDPDTWGTFADAQACGFPFTGFVISGGDPYTIIDLDNPFRRSDRSLIEEGADDYAEALERSERHSKILEAFKSYAELSQSGEGVHIIVKGRIPAGVRRDKVEIYSDSRYMICTGNVLNSYPITDQQELLDTLYGEMQARARPLTDLVQVDSNLSDEDLFTMASTATNAENFNRLWHGDWQDHYPSQSEADFALLSMLAFYTPDNAQVKRMFRWSALVRPKTAKKDYHLNLGLKKIRAMEPPKIDLSAFLNNNKLNNHDSDLPIQPTDTTNEGSDHTDTTSKSELKDTEEGVEEAQEEPQETSTLSFPPGFVGEFAKFVMDSSIRPAKEVALATALALTAGVVGRAYNISGTGLNHYIILLARTGSGKEGMARAIDQMIAAVRSQVVLADSFIGPGVFASGQALIRVLDSQPCFVSVLGEFGLTMQQLCDPRANAAQVALKRILLDLYAKSGHSSVLRPSVYSDKDKNTNLVYAPNVTILGDSTPETFYEGLDARHVAEGLIPRFSIIEYNGPRPARNPRAGMAPPQSLVDDFGALCTAALTMQQNRSFIPVTIDAEAQGLLDDFDKYADKEINRKNNEVNSQLWNRAHLKALKLSALIATGCNPHSPSVDRACAEWAINMVRGDVKAILSKFEKHDIGTGELRQEADAMRAFKDFLDMSTRRRKEYGIPDLIGDRPLVPLNFLRRRLRVLQSFRTDRRGCNAALKAVLSSLVESEQIALVPPLQALKELKTRSAVYVTGPNFDR